MLGVKKKLISYSKVIAVNLVVLAFLLLCINGACRVYLKLTADAPRSELPNYTDDRVFARKIFSDYNKIKHKYEAFSEWKTLPYMGETTTILENGDRFVPGSSSAGTPTIRFFGGSTLWGEGSDDARTIPAYFQQLNPGTRVFNHGQLAYNSRQNLESLITLLSKEDSIGTVIFYDGVNDAAFLCPREISVPGHRMMPSFQKRIYGDNVDFALIFLDNLFLSNIKRLISKISYSEKSSLAYNCFENTEKINLIADGIIRNWEMAHTLVTKSGGQFIAILQPVAYVGNAKLDHLTLDAALGRNINAVYKAIQQRIEKKNYDWLVDLSGEFDNDQYIYIDFCHVSPNGNLIIAKSVSDFMNE